MKQNSALVIGAGGGIGFALAQQLLDRGVDRLYATYHHHPPAIESPLLQIWAVDVTQEEEIATVAAQICQVTDRLDYVIYAVGRLHGNLGGPEKSLRALNTPQLLDYFQTNAIGAALWAKHLQPLFKHPERSVFACISAKVGSIGDNGLGGWYGYRASKAALNMFVKNIAIEYRRTAPESIVVALHPGTTATSLSAPFQANVPEGKLFAPERTANQLLTVIDQLEAKDSGQFFSWGGNLLPW